ncbi:hypothetical protein NDU88_007925 [Pleurodeles waltl]|uniref:Uncharacterized protein n=1 Tax=Pleurodeles waltl TaxID=8319 RepID=A0AAV7NXQ6_PLEWA|nr:hypothetical protein NDU88_007925 [Pleurodeles waltl]
MQVGSRVQRGCVGHALARPDFGGLKDGDGLCWLWPRTQDCDTDQLGNATTGNETTPCPTKRLQIRPIILKNLPTHNNLVELLEEHCTSTFTIMPQQDHAKIMLTTPEDYRSLTSVLTEQKLEHRSFSLTTVKAQHFVIWVLPANASLGHITYDLSELGLSVKKHNADCFANKQE